MPVVRQFLGKVEVRAAPGRQRGLAGLAGLFAVGRGKRPTSVNAGITSSRVSPHAAPVGVSALCSVSHNTPVSGK